MKNFEFISVAGNREPMENYMKNHFPFLGVPAPERKLQSKELLNKSKKIPLTEVMDLIAIFYQKEEREYQYLAIDLALANVNRMSFLEIQELATYVSEKSWWDSVDAWRKFFGKYVALHPEEKAAVFQLFYGHEDFWQRRVAINLQLMEKETLDTELLTQAILADRETDEFFIQKAISWSLRQYSKCNPDWVRNFLANNQLSKLATNEGSKHLK